MFDNAMLIWFLIGAALILLELFTPAFVFIFMGIGAWGASLMTLIYPGIKYEVTTFIVVTLVTLFVLRRKMVEIFQGKESKGNPMTNPQIGRQAEVVKDISSKQEGEIYVGGSYWRATADTPIAKGSIVIVRSCAENDELVLIVDPIL